MSKQEIVKVLEEIREKEVHTRYCEALDFAIEIVSREYLYQKCRDCKWLNGDKKTVGIECTNPEKEWRHDVSRYHYPTCRACKKFEEKETRCETLEKKR